MSQCKVNGVERAFDGDLEMPLLWYLEPSEHVEAQDLPIERPLARQVRPGFWRTLAHRISTSLTPTPRERHVPVCRAHRPCEGAMDQMAREDPWLSVYALAVFY